MYVYSRAINCNASECFQRIDDQGLFRLRRNFSFFTNSIGRLGGKQPSVELYTYNAKVLLFSLADTCVTSFKPSQ